MCIALSNFFCSITALEKARAGRYLPNPAFVTDKPLFEFMSNSTCNVYDFLHQRFHDIIAMVSHEYTWQRKLWERFFVIHHPIKSGAVSEGKRGLVFGVGSERLLSLFASMGKQLPQWMTAPMRSRERLELSQRNLSVANKSNAHHWAHSRGRRHSGFCLFQAL